MAMAVLGVAVFGAHQERSGELGIRRLPYIQGFARLTLQAPHVAAAHGGAVVDDERRQSLRSQFGDRGQRLAGLQGKSDFLVGDAQVGVDALFGGRQVASCVDLGGGERRAFGRRFAQADIPCGGRDDDHAGAQHR